MTFRPDAKFIIENRHRMTLIGEQLEPEAKPSKYGNEKTNGYDSAKEAARALELQMMQRAGLITELEEQPVYELIPKQKGERAVKYKPDFRYKQDGIQIIEDVKSPATKTQVYVLKRKLLLWVHGITVLET